MAEKEKDTELKKYTNTHQINTENCTTSVPNHNNCYDSNPKKHSKKLEEGGIKITLSLRLEAFSNEMVNGNINENPASKSH